MMHLRFKTAVISPLHKILHRTTSRRSRVVGLAALLPLVAATTAAAPAKAATSCQAIDSSSLLGMMPTVPSPACTSPVNVGDTFEIDFTGAFTSGNFSTSNTYSLQIANINSTPRQHTYLFQC